MLVPSSIIFLTVAWTTLLIMPSCLAKPAVATPLNSENGKKILRSAMDEVLHEQFSALPNLTKEISDLDSEFNIWKSALPSASAVELLIVAVVCLRFQRKNSAKYLEISEAKFLEISETLVEFKEKLKSMKNSIEHLKIGCNCKIATSSRTN